MKAVMAPMNSVVVTTAKAESLEPLSSRRPSECLERRLFAQILHSFSSDGRCRIRQAR